MRRKSIWLFGALSALLLAACSSPKPGTPEFAQKQEAEQQKTAVKNVESAISKTPTWFVQPPQDANALYTTGTEASPDMQMAMDMAVLSAKRALAFQLGARTSAMMKDFAGQTGTAGDAEVSREIDRVTKSVAADINLAGFTREKSEIIAEGKNYRAFTLLRYPIGESNKVVADQVKRSKVLDTRLRASKAFQDLEQEIEAARKR
ncbi:MAG: hypothetical protein RL369_1777 [Pseudomonadota bacterium]|jgi:hypothetical protein